MKIHRTGEVYFQLICPFKDGVKMCQRNVSMRALGKLVRLYYF
jgi:hypothetical protein